MEAADRSSEQFLTGVPSRAATGLETAASGPVLAPSPVV